MTDALYTINGVLQADDDPDSVEFEMDMAWAGATVFRNGAWAYLPGATYAPVRALTVDDVIEVQQVQLGPDSQDRVNVGLMSIAQDVNSGFLPARLPPRILADELTIDGSRREVDLGERGFVNNLKQAERVLVRKLREARPSLLLTLRLMPGPKLENLGLHAGDIVTYSDPRYGLEAERCLVQSATVNRDMSVTVALRGQPALGTSRITTQVSGVTTGATERRRGPKPPKLTAFTVTEREGKVRSFAFTLPEWSAIGGVRIRLAGTNVDWDNMTGLHGGLLLSSPYETQNPAMAGTYYFEARVVSQQGVESEGVRVAAVLVGLDFGGDIDSDTLIAEVDKAIKANPVFTDLEAEIERAETAADEAAADALDAEAQKTAAEAAKEAAETAKTTAEEAQAAAKAEADKAVEKALEAGASAMSADGSATAAAGSATTSSEQASASENSASAAATSAMATAASATTAQGSAMAAATSAMAAEASSDSSGTSAAAAKVDAATATTQAATATAQATLAAESATAADGSSKSAAASLTEVKASATAAKGSEDAAATSAQASATSAMTAQAQASAAGEQAKAAATQATMAATSAATASTAVVNIGSAETNADGSARAAATSAQEAAASATGAAGSATAAATSASNAATSASSVGTQATAAETSATKAATEASRAGTQASNAAMSASAADGSATAAASSARAAAAQATNAAGSATAAATSAQTASASATGISQNASAAEAAKTAAETAQAAAETAETAAAASETNAAGSASAAATSATNAASSATNASGSATTASTKATEAATAETNASGSATAAATSATEAAASATGAKDAVAGIDATVTASVDSALTTSFGAAVVLRAETGDGASSSRLELASLTNLSGSRSSAKLRADNIDFEAGDSSLKLTNGKLALNVKSGGGVTVDSSGVSFDGSAVPRVWRRLRSSALQTETRWISTGISLETAQTYTWLALMREGTPPAMVQTVALGISNRAIRHLGITSSPATVSNTLRNNSGTIEVMANSASDRMSITEIWGVTA